MKYCTVCGDVVAEAPVVDVFITRWRCARGHLFYRPHEPRNSRIPDPRKVIEPKGVSDRALLEFWLTTLHARRQMSEELASVCRRLVELGTIDVAPVDEAGRARVKFCFVCGSATKSFRSSWETGYRCEGGHTLFERGGHIHLAFEAEGIFLEPESWWAARLADRWLGDDEHTTPYISPAVRGVIARQRDSLGSARSPHQE